MISSMITMEEKLVTVPEAAVILGVSVMRVRQFCQQGLIGKKIGVQWLMTNAELAEFNARRKRTPGPEKKSQNRA